MKAFFLIVAILLIIIVLLQSGKAEAASQIISGGNLDLFSKRKERGSVFCQSYDRIIIEEEKWKK